MTTTAITPATPAQEEPVDPIHAYHRFAQETLPTHVLRVQRLLEARRGDPQLAMLLADELVGVLSLLHQATSYAYTSDHYARRLIADVEEDVGDLEEDVQAAEPGGLPYDLGARVVALLGIFQNILVNMLKSATTPDQRAELERLAAECEAVAREVTEYTEDQDEGEGEGDDEATPEAAPVV